MEQKSDPKQHFSGSNYICLWGIQLHHIPPKQPGSYLGGFCEIPGLIPVGILMFHFLLRCVLLVRCFMHEPWFPRMTQMVPCCQHPPKSPMACTSSTGSSSQWKWLGPWLLMLGAVSEPQRFVRNPQYWHFQPLAFSQDYWWATSKKKIGFTTSEHVPQGDLASTLLSLTLSVFMARETWFDIYFISFNPHDNLRRKRLWPPPSHQPGNGSFLRKNGLLMVIEWVPLQVKPSFQTRATILLCVLSAQGYTFFDGPHFKVYPPEEMLCFSDHLLLILVQYCSRCNNTQH